MTVFLAPDLAPAEAAPHAPPLRQNSVVWKLNQEWASLRDSRAANAAVAGWSLTSPALAGITSLAGVEAAVQACHSGEADGILLALLTLGRRGEQLAERTVLQLMLPKVAALVRKAPDAAARAEREATAVSAIWEAIHRYPVDRRPHRVAASLAMDAVGAVHGRQMRKDTPERPYSPTAFLQLAEPAVQLPASLEVRDVLRRAASVGVISEEEAELLELVYVVDDRGLPRDKAAIGAELGMSQATLRQRCHRATRRIAASVDAGRGQLVTTGHQTV